MGGGGKQGDGGGSIALSNQAAAAFGLGPGCQDWDGKEQKPGVRVKPSRSTETQTSS